MSAINSWHRILIICLLPILIRLFIALLSWKIELVYLINYAEFLIISLLLNWSNLIPIFVGKRIDKEFRFNIGFVSFLLIIATVLIYGVVLYTEINGQLENLQTGFKIFVPLITLSSFVINYITHKKFKYDE